MKNLNFLSVLSIEQIRAEKCRRRFYHFFLEFWETIEAVEFRDNWHVEYICDFLQETYAAWERGETQTDKIINVPPGSSKSSICTQLFPVWLWVKNPSIRIISSSYAADLSTAHAVKSRDCLKSDKFKLYFPDLIEFKHDTDNKTYYKNTKKGDRLATSTDGRVTGMHADFIIIDDPINPKKAASQVELQEASNHISQTLSTRKVDRNRTVTILIMQRLHEKDPTGRLLKEKPEKITHICLPGEISDRVNPPELKKNYINGLLDPVRLNREALDKLKIDLGSYGYAGQIKQAPSPEGGGILKKAWFGKISFEEFVRLAPAKIINFFLDTAYTKNQENDPTALMATFYHNKILYLVNSEQVWKELPDLLKHIPSYVMQHGYSRSSRIMIEPKASGKSTVQSMKGTGYNVIELPPPVDDKIARVKNKAAFVEAGRCILVEGAWNDNFLEEAGSFPNGEHDDQIDNLVNAIDFYENSNKGGGRFNF